MAGKALQTAIAAAREAGKILMDAYAGSKTALKVEYKKFHEPVTLADHASNDAIIRRLTKAFPNDEILSEESNGAELIGTKPIWVIDPLDGTTNFINHIPLFAITIARLENGVPSVGVIYDPLHDEMFVAERGKGARLNGEPIKTSTRDVTRGAMLFAGRGYRDRDRIKHGKIIYALERRTPYFRRLGSAAIMLLSVAAGRADAVILTGNRLWDTVAGVLLVEEAGGKVTDYRGRKWTYKSDDLIASNRPIHGKIVDITTKRLKRLS
jgi:myo-inositol-1(or 4)-monophosphatase